MVEGIYIHIPFCEVICSYCDFYKMRAKDNIKEKFIDYLIKELELKQKHFKDLKTIYIGGGTPSSLDLKLLEKLLLALHKLIDFENIVEFTIETNPIDITTQLVTLFKNYQINRISLGVQSFNSQVLKILGRNHSKEEAINALKLLQEAGFTNVNVDLIYGLKTDTFARVKQDIDLAKKYGAKHFSIYSLIIEGKTYLSYLQDQNKFSRLDDNSDASIYAEIVKYLANNGYPQYEISNFSHPGFESIHNLIYWNNNNYIGVGPSASYFIGNTRYTNINNLNKYFTGIDNNELVYLEKNSLDKYDLMVDEIMMGFRKVKGLSKQNFYNKYGVSIFEAFPKIDNLIKHELIVENDEYVYVKSDKLFILNAILVALM